LIDDSLVFDAIVGDLKHNTQHVAAAAASSSSSTSGGYLMPNMKHSNAGRGEALVVRRHDEALDR